MIAVTMSTTIIVLCSNTIIRNHSFHCLNITQDGDGRDNDLDVYYIHYILSARNLIKIKASL